MTQIFNLIKKEVVEKDLATLLASTHSYTAGDIITTRAEGFAYEVVDADEHLTTAGGVKLKVLPGEVGYNVKAFGAVGDGVADDTSVVQLVLDNNLPAVVSSETIKLGKLNLRSGSRLISTNNTEIVSTLDLLRAGNLGYREVDALTFVTLDSTSAGDTTVTTATAADAAGFDAGDTVYLRGSTYYTSGGEDIYDWNTVNFVVSADAGTGQIVLKYPLDEGHSTNIAISNVTQSAVVSFDDGSPLFCIDDVIVDGFSLNSTEKLFALGGGAVNCRFRFKDVTCDSFAYINNFSFTEISAQTVNFERHFFELAVGSHSNIVSAQTAILTTSPVSGKRPIRLSEGTRKNRIEIELLDLSIYTTSDVPLYLSEGRENVIDIETCLVENAPLRVFTFGAQAFAPTAPQCRDNTVRLGKCYAGGGDRYGFWSTSGGENTRNTVRDSKFFGPVSSGRALEPNGVEPCVENVWCESGKLYIPPTVSYPKVSGCYFPEDFDDALLSYIVGYPDVRGLTSDSWRVAASQNKNATAETITDTTVTVQQTQTYPAGSLKLGDVIRIQCSGFVSGTNSTKTVELHIDGTKIVNVPFAAGESGDFTFSGEIRVQATTALRYGFHIGADAASAPNMIAGSEGVADLTANALTIELKAGRANAGDTLGINYYLAKIERAGR